MARYYSTLRHIRKSEDMSAVERVHADVAKAVTRQWKEDGPEGKILIKLDKNNRSKPR
jgi:hypothetical protein